MNEAHEASWVCEACGWSHIHCGYLTKCDGCGKPRALEIATEEEPLPFPPSCQDCGGITSDAEGVLICTNCGWSAEEYSDTLTSTSL